MHSKQTICCNVQIRKVDEIMIKRTRVFGALFTVIFLLSLGIFTAGAENQTTIDNIYSTTAAVSTTAPSTEPSVPITSEYIEPSDRTTTEPSTELSTESTTEPSVESIILNTETLTLGEGEFFLLEAELDTGKDIPFLFTSSDEDIVTVTADGIIEAISKGTAYITISASENVETICKVNVKPAPTEILISKTSLTVGVGESFKLKSSIPSGTASNEILWSSSKSSVLKCTGHGVFTALKKGKSIITVEAFNGVNVTCTVTVLPAPEKISLNKTSLTLGVGESFNFNSSVPDGTASYKKTWSCNKPEILEYTKSGIFKALKAGTAKISITSFNGKKATCKVTVLPAPKKVSLNKTKLTLGVGESFNFNSSIPEGTASYKKTWTTSDTDILKYTKSGIFKALKAGTAKVTIKTFNGKKATCKVTVLPQPSRIYTANSSYTWTIGSKKQVKIKFPDNTYCSSFKYTSSDNSIASCDSKGNIHAKKIGTITITVTSLNGKKCSFKINVIAMNVPYISQMPKYPTGCEGASCTSLLKYYGYNITLDQMINTIPRKDIYYKNGKRYGPDINEYFVGNPKGGYTSSTPGYGAFSPCVTKALQSAIDARDGMHTAKKISGCSFNTLLKHISEGRPAIVWATYMMNVPTKVNSWYITETGKYFEYPRGTHVMVLVGYSDSLVTIVDPYEGICRFNIKTFEARWNLLGKQAIVLEQ